MGKNKGIFDNARSFIQENGAYLFFATSLRRPFQYLRNRMLASKLGVQKLKIGAGAHLRGLAHIALGEDLSAGDGLWLEAIVRYGDEYFQPRMIIGKHVRISHWSHIACTRSVIIGDHVLIGSKVIITDHNHGLFGAHPTSLSIPPAQRPLERDRFVIIGDNVWLGDGVVVCPGVTMGAGSVAGANAVVTTDVPPFTLVAGVPARPIRRFDAAQGTWIKV